MLTVKAIARSQPTRWKRASGSGTSAGSTPHGLLLKTEDRTPIGFFSAVSTPIATAK